MLIGVAWLRQAVTFQQAPGIRIDPNGSAELARTAADLQKTDVVRKLYLGA